jgi:hypothetical protein
VAVAVATVVVAGIVGAFLFRPVTAAPAAQAEPYPADANIEEVGVRLLPLQPGDVAKVTQDEAVAAALAAEGGLANAAKPYSIQLTRLTDEHYAPSDGPPVINNKLVWLVRFTGTPQPVYGPRSLPSQPPDATVATELNVVIDAMTGTWLESFSYR